MGALVLLVAVAIAMAPQSSVKTRCGWFDNPTPANVSLIDRDGEWLISVMGGYQAPGFDNLPDMSTRGWVQTNSGGHGYGCACMAVTTDARRHRITRVISGHPVALRQCRADPHLPKMRDDPADE
jgi:hypothetical protein